MTTVDLPAAECTLGYPIAQAETILGDRRDRFWVWMRGQTMAVCDGRQWDHDRQMYVPTACANAPHGMPIVYTYDLRRFLAGSKTVLD